MNSNCPHVDRMHSLGDKLAEGFFDNVTIFQFGTNVTEGESFQRRNVVLREDGRTVWGMVKEHTLSASRYIDRGEGRGTS